MCVFGLSTLFRADWLASLFPHVCISIRIQASRPNDHTGWTLVLDVVYSTDMYYIDRPIAQIVFEYCYCDFMPRIERV